ncbi:MBL fold metallo-hydrolase [Anaerolentibacter hominis]|uniref:MBL fold metallo-hydrolase n=1 Tax=Anaerolentibacter hominis TaxID=3079009 RepID=UPI0031B862F9
MKFCSIASGSSGNCIYVGSENTHVLVDVGISGKRVAGGLEQIEVRPDELSAILITHEHTDHISGLGVMARKYHIPVYATAETLDAILSTRSIGRIEESLLHDVRPDEKFSLGEFKIDPFSIPHDAANPVCYSLEAGNHKVAVATDLGQYDDYIVKHLEGAEILLLEANHDINMLEVGPYPYMLKKRILGERGHLSNDNSGRLICRLFNDSLKYVILGHLSKENNYPALAYETVKYELGQEQPGYEITCKIQVAKRDEPSLLITL